MAKPTQKPATAFLEASGDFRLSLTANPAKEPEQFWMMLSREQALDLAKQIQDQAAAAPAAPVKE